MLPENYSLSCRRYELVSFTSPYADNRPCGGVAILVNNKLPHRNIKLNTQFYSLNTKRTFEKYKFSAYFRFFLQIMADISIFNSLKLADVP